MPDLEGTGPETPLGGKRRPRDDRLRSEDNKMNRIGPRVKSRRQELGLTQSALHGRLAHLTGGRWNPERQTALDIERGRRSVLDTELVVLALALECSVLWLLGLAEEESVVTR
jgi:transcriptional regulator with XRE-family HTH domain